MKIIILGAGEVGAALAQHLAMEHNDITIIDCDGNRLRSLQNSMDILTITGNASYPDILRQGKAEEAELLIAVTCNDETNLVACQIAATLFQIPTKIARIRSLQYLTHKALFGTTGFPIDVLISPEQLVSDYISRLIKYPGASQVLDFADQKLQLISVKIKSSETPFKHTPRSIMSALGDTHIEIAVIFRNGTTILPTDDTQIETNDEVFFLTEQSQVRQVMSLLNPVSPPNQHIIIAGGGNVGTRLATTLEQDFQVKIIERNADQAESLATHLTKSVVLQGDASNEELLCNENIQNTDIFCAVTDQDEANIMSALLAKRLGARKTMALISRPSYLDLVEGGDIDIIVSPQQVTIGSLLTHIRRGNIVNVYSLRRGTAEAIEMIIEGNKNSSKVVGRHLKDIPLPKDAIILALVRDNDIFMGHTNAVVETNDRLILLILDKRKIRQVEGLFQEGNLTFI